MKKLLTTLMVSLALSTPAIASDFVGRHIGLDVEWKDHQDRGRSYALVADGVFCFETDRFTPDYRVPNGLSVPYYEWGLYDDVEGTTFFVDDDSDAQTGYEVWFLPDESLTVCLREIVVPLRDSEL